MKLFRLDNIHQTEQDKKEDCRGDVKLIGFFRTENDCRDVIEQLKEKPGFNLPDAFFEIRKIRVKGRKNNSAIVYRLSHEYYDGVYDYVSELGVYTTKRKAFKKWIRVRKSRRFQSHPTGFWISKETIGQISWEEGFTGWDE